MRFLHAFMQELKYLRKETTAAICCGFQSRILGTWWCRNNLITSDRGNLVYLHNISQHHAAARCWSNETRRRATYSDAI